MNFKSVGYVIGWILRLEGIFFLIPAITALIYKESTALLFFGCAVCSFLIGFLLSGTRHDSVSGVYAREGYAAVALGWIAMSAVGALPFWISGEIPSFTDALFEIISGFTTTGASILTRVEDLSHGMLLWRSFSHWVGGMGVLVFLLQIMPSQGQGMHLMRAESPGPSVAKLVPKVRQTAVVLYGIYLGLTMIETILLIIFKMPVFDSICIAMGTAGTGGFGVRSDSIAGYSVILQVIVTVFMLMFGVNFTFYYLLLSRKVKDAFHMEEVRTYLFIFTVATAVITLNVIGQGGKTGESLKDAAFSVASIMTTTGYATADFDKWPEFSRLLLVLLMFGGACAGSTGGGIKTSRLIMYVKTMVKELEILVHPRSVKVVLMDGKRLEHNVVRGANIFLISYVILLVVSTLLLSLDNFDIVTNVTAVISALSNIGPGLNMVGPTGNFAHFSALSKYVLMFDMLAGRLELFPMLLLVTPGTWKK